MRLCRFRVAMASLWHGLRHRPRRPMVVGRIFEVVPNMKKAVHLCLWAICLASPVVAFAQAAGPDTPSAGCQGTPTASPTGQADNAAYAPITGTQRIMWVVDGVTGPRSLTVGVIKIGR